MSINFKGYSWEELAECWGITVGYQYLDVAENAVELKGVLWIVNSKLDNFFKVFKFEFYWA